MHTDDMTDQGLDELYERKAEADRAVRVTVDISGVRPEFVHADPIQFHPGRVVAYLAGFGGQVMWREDIVEMRRVVHELDRQLAHLEVEARVDAAVADTSASTPADDVDEFDPSTWPTCEGCGRRQVHLPDCPVVARTAANTDGGAG